MDCRTAQMLAAFTGPGKTELDADQLAALDLHLRHCPQCAKVIYRERAFDQKMTRAIRSITIPSGLKAAILAKVTPNPVWYRRRSWQVSLATAAAILIGFWFIIAGNRATTLDLQSVVETQLQPSTKELALKWLEQQGIEFSPELPLNLDLLATYGKRDFLGREVPSLFLLHPDKQASALIFVVRSRQFDWSEIPKIFSGSGMQIERLDDLNHPGDLSYIVFYTENLAPFLTQKPAV